MKTGAFRIPLLLFAFASASIWAGELELIPRLPNDANVGSELDTASPPAPPSSLFKDFKLRLEAAMQSREISTIAALYQTNGVRAGDLKSELTRWQPMIREDAKGVFLYFKELSKLPPVAHDVWSAKAHSLTDHEVTHLVYVQSGNEVRLLVPLVVAGDRLLIVPSDKRTTKSGIEPDGPANGCQPSRSE